MAQESELTLAVAGSIRSDFAGCQGLYLPSHRVLANRYSVSRLVVTQAIKVLSREGFVVAEPRRRVRLAHNDLALTNRTARRDAPAPEAPVDRVYRHIRERLSSGEYASGQRIPKISWIARTGGFSTHTVLKAIRRLAAEGFIHSQGRFMIAGQRKLGPSAATAPPIVLVVTMYPNSLSKLSNSSWARPFFLRFATEANNARARVINSVCSKGAPDSFSHYLKGIAEIRRTLAEAGSRYRGALLAVERYELEHPAVQEVVRELFAMGLPVAWFDRQGGPPCQFQPRRGFTRYHYDEPAFSRCAVEHLAQWGHRRVLFVSQGRNEWEQARLTAVREAAERITPPLEVTARTWLNSWPLFIEALPELERDAPPRVLEAIDIFRRNNTRLCSALGLPAQGTWAALRHVLFGQADKASMAVDPSVLASAILVDSAANLLPIIRGVPITAVVGANDLTWRSFLRNWVRELDIPVPSRMSAMSFDNEFQHLYDLPTTVDTGFDSLAFQAFHGVFGDVAVPVSRTGDVASVPFVVDKETVTAPYDGTAPRSGLWGRRARSG